MLHQLWQRLVTKDGFWLMSNALIWGASGGIGRAPVTQLINSGWCVFAAARDVFTIPNGVQDRYPFDAANLDSIKDISKRQLMPNPQR